MGTVSIANAKAHLSELVERAVGGETVQITRRGMPVAQIVAAKAQRKRSDIEALRSMVGKGPMQEAPTGDFVRRMRDEACY